MSGAVKLGAVIDLFRLLDLDGFDALNVYRHGNVIDGGDKVVAPMGEALIPDFQPIAHIEL